MKQTLIFFIILVSGFRLVAQNQMEVKAKNELISMHDGVLLATDIYLPQKNVSSPVVLIRTPYNKQSFKEAAERFVKGILLLWFRMSEGNMSRKVNSIL